jgi:hypothetical protein
MLSAEVHVYVRHRTMKRFSFQFNFLPALSAGRCLNLDRGLPAVSQFSYRDLAPNVQCRDNILVLEHLLSNPEGTFTNLCQDYGQRLSMAAHRLMQTAWTALNLRRSRFTARDRQGTLCCMWSSVRHRSALKSTFATSGRKQRAPDVHLTAFRLAGHANLVDGTGIGRVTPAARRIGRAGRAQSEHERRFDCMPR